MTEAEQIQAEASQRADMENGRIVAEFLMADSATCRCCQFVEERMRFQQLLRLYTNAKINAHRWRARFYGERADEVYYRTDAWRRERSWIEELHAVQRYHFSLDQMKPCFRCRLKYNPTGKAKFMGHRFWGWDGVTYIGRRPDDEMLDVPPMSPGAFNAVVNAPSTIEVTETGNDGQRAFTSGTNTVSLGTSLTMANQITNWGVS